MRSCKKEVIEPIIGEVIGKIPSWLKGTLLRNGPGSLQVGEYSFNHLFDSSALLHRYVFVVEETLIDWDISFKKSNNICNSFLMIEIIF